MWAFSTLAVLAGAAIALQAAMNARLGVQLANPLLATGIAFSIACLVTLVIMILFQRNLPVFENIKLVPGYLWFGGLFSAFGVGSYYYLIPKMGVGNMMSYALSGQLVLAVIASHFGWFAQPVKPITIKVFIGIVAMIVGIVFVNAGAQSDA